MDVTGLLRHMVDPADALGGADARGAHAAARDDRARRLERGLVLVTGPTRTGKTTTIAAMIGHINRTRRTHIVTIEDPIEVVHDDDRAIIQQREVGLDTGSYAAFVLALRGSLLRGEEG